MVIEDNKEYYNITFSDLNFDHQTLDGITFESCTFADCSFNETSFYRCKLVETTFKSSVLTLVKVSSTYFSEVEFYSCKMTGINWTYMNYPTIVVTSPIHFNACDISYSNFYELKLPDMTVIDCKAYDVDFRLCDLTNADFTNTDLEKSQFMHTKLDGADFTDAINYLINPMENSLKKAKFSTPDVINLLRSFDIVIDETGL